MRCQFCHLDVETPCRSIEQMQQRAADHLERCEHAKQDMRASSPRSGE
jgi:hypothetical protein